MLNKYFGCFTSLGDVIENFEITMNKAPLEEEIVIAAYGGGTCNGIAFVVFGRDEKLFEVRASHCSCFGLEDQWEPEETSWAALKMWKFDEEDWDEDFIKAWKTLLENH